ncbi:MAG: UvrD-helicase domain-containing protein [Rickettsiales bacterium]|nr:UvrD-helicase domain-containing protein [Rickettsiales bacterium]
MKDFFLNLNDSQLQAVNYLHGPLLVLAGAGTGKTTVLTSRIANLVASQVALPEQIMAVTFTNKAALEMKERISDLLEMDSALINIGTFHSLSAKFLRKYSHLIGLASNFLIIDQEDQINLIKKIQELKKIDPKEFPAKKLAFVISSWKDKALNPNDINASHLFNEAAYKANEIYQSYQDNLKDLNAVDFGDLILQFINLLKNNDAVLSDITRQIKYILVDEYQDTNVAQYLWLKLLSQGNNNVCCVGDDDQSIYSFRGAEVQNILRFEKDYKGAKIIKLQENYRSTQNILNAANNLIGNNQERYKKELFTKAKSGDKIKLLACFDDTTEANSIIEEIKTIYQKTGTYKNIAVLVRAFFQTRIFEDNLVNQSIPYKIYGGLRFYERKEIKDLISYIRLVVNNSDNLAFERIINTPKRGLGPISYNKITDYAYTKNISYFHALKDLNASKQFSAKLTIEISAFLNLIDSYAEQMQTEDFALAVGNLINDSGYIRMLKEDKKQDNESRIENIKEFIKAIEDFHNVEEFIEHVNLVSENQSSESEDHLVMMTLHQSKGLEFDNVFLTGWEDGLFPHQRSLEESGTKALEEERRLAYVGITRAKRNLFISYANNRRMYNQWQSTIPSRFIRDLPNDCYEETQFYNKQKFFKPSGNKSFNRSETTSNLNNKRNDFVKDDKVEHDHHGIGIIKSVIGDVVEVKFDNGKIRYTTANSLKKVS